MTQIVGKKVKPIGRTPPTCPKMQVYITNYLQEKTMKLISLRIQGEDEEGDYIDLKHTIDKALGYRTGAMFESGTPGMTISIEDIAELETALDIVIQRCNGILITATIGDSIDKLHKDTNAFGGQLLVEQLRRIKIRNTTRGDGREIL